MGRHWSAVMIRLFTALFVALLALPAPVPPTPAKEKTILVFAAASLKNALDDVNAAYTRAKGVKVTASYAASSALMRQIEQGAPADVFASADLEWMDYGSQKKVINDASRVNLLGNKLVLIASKESKLATDTIRQNID